MSISKIFNKKSAYWRLMRLDRPLPYLLLIIPFFWVLAIAYYAQQEHLRHFIRYQRFIFTEFNLLFWGLFFAFGAFMLRSAGCVINDIWDRKLDAKVKRTQGRPLVTGEVTLSQAVALAGFLLLASSFLLIFLPKEAIFSSLIAGVMIFIYPLCKRFTYLAQFFLGAAFNMGIFVLWYSLYNRLNIVVCLLYMACMAWTVAYDTIYALQDVDCDKKAGAKSTALFWRDKIEFFLSKNYEAMLLLLSVIGFNLDFSLLFFAFLGVLWFLIRKYIDKLSRNEALLLRNVFQTNLFFAIIITIAIVNEILLELL